MIKTAVMGYGTIGSGVTEILAENRDVIAAQAGQEDRAEVCAGSAGVSRQPHRR